jgi:hypothetical protein
MIGKIDRFPAAAVEQPKSDRLLARSSHQAASPPGEGYGLDLGSSWLGHIGIWIVVCLLWLPGCSSTNLSRQSLTDQHPHLPTSVELVDTPFFPQTRHQCGPAALATILKSHHIDVTPEMLSSQLFIPDRQGSLQIEMVASARHHNMLPYPLNPTLPDLLTEVAAGNPVLVLQNLRFDWWPRWHYAVIIGYDIENEEIILRSGTTERWVSTFAAFDNTWRRAERWALVIVPLSNVPATASVATYLRTAYAFEQTGMDQQALSAYQSASRKWPESHGAWITLGNMEYEFGHFTEAVSALMNAAQLSPETPMVWNNLAYALHASGCVEQARQSLQCAYRLAPDDSNIRDSEQQLSNMAHTKPIEQCPPIDCD